MADRWGGGCGVSCVYGWLLFGVGFWFFGKKTAPIGGIGAGGYFFLIISLPSLIELDK